MATRRSTKPKRDLAKEAEGWEETLKVDDATKKAFADKNKADEKKPIRVPVKYRYDAVHPDFLKMMAEIGAYADGKYGSWAQYLEARLAGDADPINHIYEHLREFRLGVPYDHFEGDPRRHLVAIAYNAMMKFVEICKWGWAPEPYSTIIGKEMWPPPKPGERPLFRGGEAKPIPPGTPIDLDLDRMMGHAMGAMLAPAIGESIAKSIKKARAKAKKKKKAKRKR